LGGYDVVFILKVLSDHNDICHDNDKYTINCVFRDNKIIQIKISKIINNNKGSVTICDSYCMLDNKSSKLGVDFEVNTLKGIFPYDFRNKVIYFILVIHRI
jgi:hypothetical protein